MSCCVPSPSTAVSLLSAFARTEARIRALRLEAVAARAVAQLADSDGLAGRLLCGRRVTPACVIAEQPPRFVPCCIWRPRRVMASNRVPALASFGGPIEQEIGSCLAFLSAGTKTGNGPVPHHLSRLPRLDVALADSLALAHGYFPCALASR